MGEQDALKALGVYGEWIWGDDYETTVFAQAFGHKLTLIFRFKLDNLGSPDSVATRIVNCYHGVAGHTSATSFSDRSAMRKTLWEAVAVAWVKCNKHPNIQDPDVIIDIRDITMSESTLYAAVKVNHQRTLYANYLQLLKSTVDLSLAQQQELVPFTSLVREDHLGGRGATTLVYRQTAPQTKYVFKGIDFRTFLNSYEGGQIVEQAKTFYSSIKMIYGMPRHPNIMAPPTSLVTVKNYNGTQLVCGTLTKFLPNGSLASQIEQYTKSRKRLPLSYKARWCYQISIAIEHTHLVAHTYHMDIKPGNFLVNGEFDLLLIDWEQDDAPVTTAAPEIDGTWDVSQPSGDKTAPLVYTKYEGSPRCNMPECTPGNNGWNVWNVFPIWNVKCPKALELAEVFSVGRTMWMLLRQPDMDRFQDVERTEEIVEDWEGCEDIPNWWKRMVEASLERNPNDRVGIQELAAFWSREYEEMTLRGP